jgi:hypothetical protein
MIRLLCAFALCGIAVPAPAATRNFIIGSFNSIRVDGPFAVVVTTGKPPSGNAQGSLDALDAVTLEVNGDTLVVSMGAGNWTSDAGKAVTPPTITVTTPTLDHATINSGATLSVDAMKGQQVALALNGTGTLSVGAIRADQLTATIVGTGQMTLAGTAARGRFVVSGPGTIEATDLTVDDLTARSDGPGALNLAARYTADVTSTGLGPITVAGTASCHVRAIAGGSIRCGRQ